MLLVTALSLKACIDGSQPFRTSQMCVEVWDSRELALVVVTSKCNHCQKTSTEI